MTLDGTGLIIAFALASGVIIVLSYVVRSAASTGAGFGRDVMGKLVMSILGVGGLVVLLQLTGIIDLPLP